MGTGILSAVAIARLVVGLLGYPKTILIPFGVASLAVLALQMYGSVARWSRLELMTGDNRKWVVAGFKRICHQRMLISGVVFLVLALAVSIAV